MVAAALSAYLEVHARRLLAGEPLVTVVPSRSPMVSSLLRVAADHGWFSASVTDTGEPLAHSQRGANRQTRLRRRPRDWSVLGRIKGPVLLLDDFYSTGATMYSYAGALRAAGASEVRGLTVERVVGGTRYPAQLERLRASGSTSRTRWRPDQHLWSALRYQ